jgi:hypothetical protein
VTVNVSDFSGCGQYDQGLMRNLAILLAALTMGLAMPGVAAPLPHANGNGGNGNGSGNGGVQASPAATPSPPAAARDPGPRTSHSSEGRDEKDSEPRGKAKAPAETPLDQPKNGSTSPVQTKPAGKDKPQTRATPPDQDAAQQAVERLEALPLAKIVKIAERRAVGKVINARLLRVSGVLLYQLTRLDDGGKSWRDYYNAATGNPVLVR